MKSIGDGIGTDCITTISYELAALRTHKKSNKLREMIVYTGSPEDSGELVRFVRSEIAKLRSLRKLVISRQETVLYDINKDGIEFPGLTYGSAALEPLLHELGVVFAAQTLHNPNATPSGVKEFDLSARPPWGQERVM